MAYGLGASIVIVGALFKIMHFKIGPLTGGVMLTLGMAVEALVFAISAFEPVDEDLDWSLVYPELAGGNKREQDRKQAHEAQGLARRGRRRRSEDPHLEGEGAQVCAVSRG